MELLSRIKVLHTYEYRRLRHLLKTQGEAAVLQTVYVNYVIYFNAVKRGIQANNRRMRHPMRSEFVNTLLEYRWVLRRLGLPYSVPAALKSSVRK